MNKILVVALDLTDHDHTLIRYAKQLQSHYNIGHIHFIHNIKVSELDELLTEMLEDIQIAPIIQRNLEHKVQQIFHDETTYTLTLLEGDNTEFGINEWVKTHKETATILLGWKTAENGTGAMAQKLIRLSQADILLVPKEHTFAIERLLIPSDFSATFSKVKIKVEKLGAQQVQVLKVYNIPSVFFPFIDDEATQLKAEKLAKTQYAEFSKKLNIPPTWQLKTQYRKEKSVADIIARESRLFQANLVVLAAKGSNSIPSIFLGSTTNELINKEPFHAAIYVVK
ncbi:universal stress protein [Sphingobacterium paucimobilis]|uniref:UspA domain-containing protein n=1 Tax=Sphingobacterium paucimobilis HER1398 TaxID=1346330 RepID=U2J404_9SPHI|nr:universal stress protein [Sphingobacterium paucimobilis]ERJ57378.1 hypothetical protein M472_01225 [Sphingobacterium paucimobilis HER1398]